MMREDVRSSPEAAVVSAARSALGKPAKPSKKYEPLGVATPRDALRVRDTALPAGDDDAPRDREMVDAHAVHDRRLRRAGGDSNGSSTDGAERIQIDESASDGEGDTEARETATTTSIDDDPPRVTVFTHSDSRTTTVADVPCTQIAIVALSAISGFLFGYDLCVMVVALPLIHEAFQLSTAMAEAVVSILMVGAVFGSLAGGVLADRYGRKQAIILTSVFFLLGSLCMTFAESIHVMLLGRFLAGLAVGSSGPCVSTYVAEIAAPEHRGALVTINEVMLCVGCLVSVVVSSSQQHSVDGWRRMLGVTLLPPLVQLAGMPFVPESPRWLVTQKDRADEARAVLRRLFPQRNLDQTDAQIEAQLAAKGLSTGVWDVLRLIATDDTTRRRVVLSLLVALAHTLTGANAMLYYSSYIIESLGPRAAAADNGTLKESDAASFSGVSKELGVALAKLTGVCTAIVVVDRVGRRSLLLFGSLVMLLADVAFAWSFWGRDGAASSDDDALAHETLGIWTLYAFIYAWNVSWAPLMWVICSEVLADDLRSVGMGLTFAVYWLGSSLVNQTLLSIFQVCGMAASFLVYGSLTLAAIAFIYWKVPETRGRSFEEISRFFAKGK